jgi:enamine deaminase RidA (YjgF/YER057c/UK114 family)
MIARSTWRAARRLANVHFQQRAASGSIDTRVKQLFQAEGGLPNPIDAKGNYVMCVRDGNMLYISGHGPQKGDTFVKGRLGEDMDVTEGKECARLVALSMLATIQHECGSLDKVKRVVKTLGFVNCTTDFEQQADVINGFSDTMAEVFGPERGVGVRSALGTSQLPFTIPVEVEAVVELHFAGARSSPGSSAPQDLKKQVTMVYVWTGMPMHYD